MPVILEPDMTLPDPGISDGSAATDLLAENGNIPLPSIGHWTKVEVGHKIPAAPLIADQAEMSQC